MLIEVAWFIAMAGITGLALAGGVATGKGSRSGVTLAMTIAPLTLFIWAWLMRRPSIASEAIPSNILSHIEGVGAVPIFMFIIGVIWARSTQLRHQRMALLAMALGVVFYFTGGLWMIQPTPRKAMAEHYQPGLVKQSSHFSCVPASCATALNMVGVMTTEAEMGDLTRTRPGTGTTLIRALDGLDRRLAQTPNQRYDVEILEPSFNQLLALKAPILAPLQIESARQHMVTLIEVTSGGVWIADPYGSVMFKSRREFEDVYTGRVIVFTKR